MASAAAMATVAGLVQRIQSIGKVINGQFADYLQDQNELQVGYRDTQAVRHGMYFRLMEKYAKRVGLTVEECRDMYRACRTVAASESDTMNIVTLSGDAIFAMRLAKCIEGKRVEIRTAGDDIVPVVLADFRKHGVAVKAA
jgi:hypothetical protein